MYYRMLEFNREAITPPPNFHYNSYFVFRAAVPPLTAPPSDALFVAAPPSPEASAATEPTDCTLCRFEELLQVAVVAPSGPSDTKLFGPIRASPPSSPHGIWPSIRLRRGQAGLSLFHCKLQDEGSGQCRDAAANRDDVAKIYGYLIRDSTYGFPKTAAPSFFASGTEQSRIRIFNKFK